MGKKLRNKVIAVAVAATMTIPEVASVGAEVLQDLTEINENITEQIENAEPEEDVQDDSGIFSENEEVSVFSEDVSEDEDTIISYYEYTDMAKAGESSITGSLVLDYSDPGSNSDYYDFTIRGGKVIAAEKEDFNLISDNFKILYKDMTPSDKWEVSRASVDGYDEDGYHFTVKGKVKKDAEKGVKYTLQYTSDDLTASAAFEYEPEVFGLEANNLMYNKTASGYFDYFDDITVEKKIKVEVQAVNADKLALYDLSKLELLSKAEYSDSNKITTETPGFKEITVETIPDPDDESKVLDNKVNVVITVTNEFESCNLFLAYNEKIVKTADGRKNLSVRYTRNICALAEKIDEEASKGKEEKVYQKGTKIKDGILTYDGDADQLVINSVYNKQTITGVEITGANVKSVILPYTVKKLDSNSFASNVESVVLPDTLKKAAADTFDSAISKIYYNGDKSIFDAGVQDKVVPYSTSLEEGEELEIDVVKLAANIYDIPAVKSSEGTDTDEKDYSKIKWIIESVDGKSTKTAVLESVKDADDKIIDQKVKITRTKANGMFNNQIIVKAVSAEDAGRVYAISEYYITPKKTTEINSKIKAEEEITVNVGGSYKLDTKAEDGVNKNLIYETESKCFTVVNGIITGVKAGKGTVTVKSESNPDVSRKFTVNVSEPDVKLTTDVKSLSLVYNEPRTFVVNTGVSGEKTVKFDYNTSLFEISYDNGGTKKVVNPDNSVGIDVTQKFTVKVKDGVSLAKTDKVQITSDKSSAVISLVPATTDQNVIQLNESIKKLTDGFAVINIPVGTSYNIGVSVLPVTADQSLNYEMSKAVKSDDEKRHVLDKDSASAVTPVEATLKNSIFTAEKEGTYYVQAESVGKDVNGKTLKSNIYKINVYESGGSIEWKDENYVVQGGFLMEKSDAETTCTKMITGGKTIIIDAPETAGFKEDITWTSSNPGSLSIVKKKADDGDESLELGLIAAGTYTVTGTTKYTNQKYVFKVNVAETEDVSGDIAIIEVYNKESDKWESDRTVVTDSGVQSVEAGSPVELPVGTETSVRLSTPACSTKITYKSLQPKLVSCDAKGNIKVLSADGNATVTAAMTMKSGKTITSELVIKPTDDSEPALPVINVQLSECIQDNSNTTGIKYIDEDGNIKKSQEPGTITVISGGKLKDISGVSYSYYENELETDGSIKTNADGTDVKKPDSDKKISVDDDLKVNGLDNTEVIKRFTLSADYTYEDKVRNIFLKRFNVYQVLATKVSVHPEDAAKVKRLATAGTGLKAGNGAAVKGQQIVIDFLAEGTVAVTDKETGKIVNKTVCATADDIEWTSSNTFLAKIETIDHKEGTGNSIMEDHVKGCKADLKTPYAKSLLITANDNNYKGIVTFTGTFKNSGKKVTFKVLVE